ncbi:unnamed protein product [Linum trigynum]|uniref:Uncharacterized protein n=1 Tax=Linum trigynum TaxID=586398 RepID=A0AAV2F1Z1_9ROSI
MRIAIVMSSSSSSRSLDPSAKATARKATGGAVERVPPATFPNTVWGRGFLDKVDLSLQAKQGHPKYEILKEEVRKMVKYEAKSGNDKTKIADKLRLIDTIQRLGIGYHFETEIEEALERVHDLGEDSSFNNIDEEGTDLYHKALQFRLLRQQGFRVSTDGFRKFMNNEGKFEQWLATDERGLLSLYEASHIAFNGEDTLDEALSFATKSLKSLMQHKKINPSFQKQIDFAFRVPAWKCVPRSLARHSIDFYSGHQDTSLHNQKLLMFAKLDFNMVQKFHQQELQELADWWWGSIYEATDFPYVRDRLVESYYGINSIFFEPKYRLGRIIATKFWLVLTILDDAYDNYATYEEVQSLTEAVDERLDARALQELPDSVKKVHRIILNMYDDFEREVGEIGPTFGVEYFKEELKRIIHSYLGEVECRNEGRVPTLEEYMIHGYGSSGIPVLCASAMLGMGAEVATREAFEWVANESKMMKATAVIGRFRDDIFTHKFEQERGHSASAVECYMEEYKASEEEAVEFLWKKISNAWKDVAEECQKPSLLPVAITERVLNLARLVSVLYENGDCFTNPHLIKDHLKSLFIDPVPL